MQKHISVRTPHVTRLGVKVPLEPFYSESFGIEVVGSDPPPAARGWMSQRPGNPVKGALAPPRALSSGHEAHI